METGLLRYIVMSGMEWQHLILTKSLAIVVPVEHREHYSDIYPISLVRAYQDEEAGSVDDLLG